MSDPVLAARHVGKSFGRVEVLHDVSIELMPGQIHAIIGENGAGKSTLMRILAGLIPPTTGDIVLDGQTVRFRGPADAESRGIVLVHQEILLAGQLTVAQNLYLGRETCRGPFLDDRSMRAGAAGALRELGVELAPDAVVDRLSIGSRQFVQIARALLVPHRVVILDEPTAALTPVDAKVLFGVIRRLAASGAGVLYISHRLSEVKAIADTVTVLRDGERVGTWPASGLEPSDMARLMVGREAARLYPARVSVPPGAETALELRRVTVPGFARDVSITVRRAEILGIGGLVGAGRTELFEGVVGLRSRTDGEVRLFGGPVRFGDAGAAFATGLVYISEDRKGKGLLLSQNLRTNLTLAALHRFTDAFTIDRRRECAALDRAVEKFDIRVRQRDLLAGQMSGGNQQKLLLAKMMQCDPKVLIIDEPTRGVDIGTKAQIYRFIADLASRGIACIVISSEMQELIGLCHNIVVMRAGTVAGELRADIATEDAIVLLATGLREQPASRRSAA